VIVQPVDKVSLPSGPITIVYVLSKGIELLFHEQVLGHIEGSDFLSNHQSEFMRDHRYYDGDDEDEGGPRIRDGRGQSDDTASSGFLDWKDVVRDLGFLIDARLRFGRHVTKICSKVYATLYR
jgi:hypothetical protein